MRCNNRFGPLLLLALLHLAASAAIAADSLTLAFGSCLRQWQPQPVWDGILAVEPDVFIFTGDNVYTDRGPYWLMSQPERIGRAYAELAADDGFRRLRERTPILATWDDHDYGANNAGADYRFKEASKAYFLDFFRIPADAAVRRRPGIYRAQQLDGPAGPVHVILLDTRSFRSPLVYGAPDADCFRSRIIPNTATDATLLGDAQWAWLEGELQKPAALRVIVSSIQVIPEQHCFEKWANFPRERQRLLDLLATANGGRSLIISGDRHLAEMSRIEVPGLDAPIYEVTSSGLNSARSGGDGERNRFRLTADNVRLDNFGVIRLHAHDGGHSLSLEIRGATGAILQQVELPLPPD